MVGPSSSHTAGVARLGRIAYEILNEPIKKAEIKFFGSLAETYLGHGSDKAVLGGLLGYNSSDLQLADAIEIAQAKGLEYSFTKQAQGAGHPNTILIKAWGVKGNQMEMLGSSRGGGRILVEKINGFPVQIRGDYPVLWVLVKDRLGVIGEIASLIADSGINIASMGLERSQPGGLSSLVFQLDSPLNKEDLAKIEQIADINSCRLIGKVQ